MNPNLFTAQIIVNSLADAGLTAVIISPGSRSTPLVLAFHNHPDIDVHVHMDERSAGFFALGMALETDAPVALLCSSGTAVSNYLPAIIEAKMSHVPLLVLTADRPPELRHSGANQTIDQVKIYGNQVLWSVDMPLPESDPSETVIHNLAATAHRAYAIANGIVKGAVHLNFPFRKPLHESRGAGEQGSGQQLSIINYQLSIKKGVLLPTSVQIEELAVIVDQFPRGLIICGPRCPGDGFETAVTALSHKIGYPILADPLSGIRWQSPHPPRSPAPLLRIPPAPLPLSGYETYLRRAPDWDEPRMIIRFGAVPLSKWLNDYLGRIAPVHRVHVRANGVWADDSHRTTSFLQADEAETCRLLTARVSEREDRGWETAVYAQETTHWKTIAPKLRDGAWFDGAVVAETVAMVAEQSVIMMGNSLPVRHLDQFGQAGDETSGNKAIRAYANRGASGIDGNISTALGIAAATDDPVTLIIGDVTFFHDMNGLIMAKQAHNLTIVLINNDGGGIFRRLPISQVEPPFTELFTTPHGLDFSHTARLYGLGYVAVDGREEFREAFRQNSPIARIIEVKTNGRYDYERWRELNG